MGFATYLCDSPALVQRCAVHITHLVHVAEKQQATSACIHHESAPLMLPPALTGNWAAHSIREYCLPPEPGTCPVRGNVASLGQGSK